MGDFGLSTYLPENLENFEQSEIYSIEEICMTKNIGTPLYIAPELEKSKNYNEKVDIYALGIILFEMFYIFKTLHEKYLIFTDFKKFQTIPKTMQKSFKEECLLINLLCCKNPDKRPLIHEIFKCKEFIAWKKKFEH